MKAVMSIAAGLAVGYFIFQYFTNTSKGTTHGRLHKSTTDRKISGVCGGIAEYLGVDSTLVRLAWAALCLGWGSGILAYIVCSLILPEE